MVDNLTIMLEKFSGNFENCEIVKVFENIGIYRLKGLSRIAPHPLRLIYIRRTGRLYIVNSLRKWYCGRTSLFDLTSETLVHALKRLAADLNISYEELGRGRVTQVEVGLNLWTRIPCRRLIRLMAGYKTRSRNVFKDETVYFGDRSYKKVIV